MTTVLPTVTWSERVILENGMDFLKQKKQELEIYVALWESTWINGYYSKESTNGAKTVKTIAQICSKDVSALQHAAMQKLNLQLKKEPLAKEAKSLSDITLAASYGLNYFNAIATKNTPSTLSANIREAKNLSEKFLVASSILSSAALCVDSPILSDKIFPIFVTAWKVSIASFLLSTAAHWFNKYYFLNPKNDQIYRAKALFQNALML